MDDGGEWITLAEAAKRLGVTRAAVYGRIDRKTLTTRPRGNRGLEVLWPGGDITPNRQGDGNGNVTHNVRGDNGTAAAPGLGGAAITEALAQLRRVLNEARADAAAARVETAAERAEAARLRDQLAVSQLALTRAEEQAKAVRAVAEADSATAQADVAAKEEVLAEVRRSLDHERARAERVEAEARRPWWQKLWG